MRNKITTEELIKKRFNDEEQKEIFKEIEKEVNLIKWGGKREGAGRKSKNGEVLQFTKRLTQKEAKFIDYARAHNLNYDDLMHPNSVAEG